MPSFSGAPNRISSRVAALLENWPGHLRKLQNLHNFSAMLSHLESTLTRPLGCVDSKTLTETISCLAATLRKNRGEGGRIAVGSAAAPFQPWQTSQNFGARRVCSVRQPSATRLRLRNPATCPAGIWIVDLLPLQRPDWRRAKSGRLLVLLLFRRSLRFDALHISRDHLKFERGAKLDLGLQCLDEIKFVACNKRKHEATDECSRGISGVAIFSRNTPRQFDRSRRRNGEESALTR